MNLISHLCSVQQVLNPKYFFFDTIQGSVVSVKVIRDKNTGLPAGYGFVEFSSHEIASQVLACYNGAPIPGTNKNFRLNWGIFGGGTKATNLSNNNMPVAAASVPMQQQQQKMMGGGSVQGGSNPDYSIYVGDIDAQVNDLFLIEYFQKRYKSVVSAKVIVDPITKYSKGYGFVKFSNFEESQRAISEMQGSLLKNRHIKTSQSFWKSANQESNYISGMGMGSGVASPQAQSNPTSTYPTNQGNPNANYYLNYYNSLMGNNPANNNSLSYYEAMLPYLQQQQQGYQNNSNMGGPQMDQMMGYGGNNYMGGNANMGMETYYQHPQQNLGINAVVNNQYAQSNMMSTAPLQMNNSNQANAYSAANYQTNYQQTVPMPQNFSKNPNAGNSLQTQNQNLSKGGNNYPNNQTFHNYNTSANQIVQQDLINNAQISTNYGSAAINNNEMNRYGTGVMAGNYYGIGGFLGNNGNENSFEANRLNMSKFKFLLTSYRKKIIK